MPSVINEASKKSYKALLLLIAFIDSLYKTTLSRLRLQLFLRRRQVIQVLSDKYFISKQKECQIFVVITHIVKSEEAKNAEVGRQKIERLCQTIDGLLSSFSRHNLKILINTLPDGNIVSIRHHYETSRMGLYAAL